MRNELEDLRKERADLSAQVQSLRVTVAELKAENLRLKQQNQFLMNRMFGRASEKLDSRQMELLLNLSAVEVTIPVVETLLPPLPARRRVKRERKPRLAEHLPTEDIIIDPEEVKQSPELYVLIGEEITQEFDVVPPKYFRRRFIAASTRTRQIGNSRRFWRHYRPG